MRRAIFVSILLLSACSAEREQEASDRTYDVQEEPAPSMVAPPPMAPETSPPLDRTADMAAAEQAGGPNINVSAAPGVAFNYRYAYRLPNSRISAAQEAHAAAFVAALLEAPRSGDDLAGGTFDTQFTFAQSLTEAVKGTPGVLLAISIPASDNADDATPGSAEEVGGGKVQLPGFLSFERAERSARTGRDWSNFPQ